MVRRSLTEFYSITSTVWNRRPFSEDFNFGNKKKSVHVNYTVKHVNHNIGVCCNSSPCLPVSMVTGLWRQTRSATVTGHHWKRYGNKVRHTTNCNSHQERDSRAVLYKDIESPLSACAFPHQPVTVAHHGSKCGDKKFRNQIENGKFDCQFLTETCCFVLRCATSQRGHVLETRCKI